MPDFEETDVPTHKEQIKMRKQLLYGALHDGKSQSLEQAIQRAACAYNWIMTGNSQPLPESPTIKKVA